MIKIFSELKATDLELFKEVVKAAYAEAGSESWFVMRTWGEIESAAKFTSAHSWEIDVDVIRSKLTGAEWNFIKGLVNNTKDSFKDSRQRAHKVSAQRSERFVNSYLSKQETRLQMAELQSKLKKRPSDDKNKQWENLSKQLFN